MMPSRFGLLRIYFQVVSRNRFQLLVKIDNVVKIDKAWIQAEMYMKQFESTDNTGDYQELKINFVAGCN